MRLSSRSHCSEHLKGTGSVSSFFRSLYVRRILLFTEGSRGPSGWLIRKVICFNNNNNGSHLLSTYYKTGSLKSTLCELTWRMFVITLGGQMGFYLITIFQINTLQLRELLAHIRQPVSDKGRI